MAHDYIPRRDQEFLGWSRAFSIQISATPEQFGLTAPLASQYAALHDAYAAALAAAKSRAVYAIATKKEARKAAEKQARVLVRIIQAHPGVTNDARKGLAITVRDTQPAAIGRPVDRPSVFVHLRFGSTLRIKLRDPDSPRRGRPKGIAGARIYSFVGESPPVSSDQWQDEGITMRTSTDITLQRGITPGAQVWIAACWFNPRGQCGPVSPPKPIRVQCPTLWLDNGALRSAA